MPFGAFAGERRPSSGRRRSGLSRVREIADSVRHSGDDRGGDRPAQITLFGHLGAGRSRLLQQAPGTSQADGSLMHPVDVQAVYMGATEHQGAPSERSSGLATGGWQGPLAEGSESSRPIGMPDTSIGR